MSIFGKLDATTIPTNPFFIEKGDYEAEVVTAKFQTNRDSIRQLYIQYEITNEDSIYLGKRANKIYDLVSDDMTAEAFELLPTDEKKSILRNLSSLKKDLCGNDANTSQKGLGVPLDDLNDPNWNPAVLVGTKVNIGINNWGADNQGVNVRWVNIREE